MIKKILCVLKTTGYEYYKNRHDVFEKFDKRKQQILEKEHTQQKKLEKTFRKLVTQLEFDMTYVIDKEMETYLGADYDLIISFGGDGTFLNAAQHFKDSLLLGINSYESDDVTQGSVGALTSTSESSLAFDLKQLKKGNYQIQKWKRLYAKVNGKRLPALAVNDIYFGALEAYKTTHFELFWNDNIEAFRGSSGIVFSTGMGSTSWFRNIGGPPFANELPIYGFIVRDPQLSRRPSYIEGIVDGEEEVILKSMRSDYVLSFDSNESEYEIKEFDELRIGLSKKEPVRVIKFD